MVSTLLLLFCGLGLPDSLPASADTVAVSAQARMAPAVAPLPTVGSYRDGEFRMRALMGSTATEAEADDVPPAPWPVLRSPSILAERSHTMAGGTAFRIRMVEPQLRMVWNSRLPVSMNEGSLWAGRGAATLARAGVRLDAWERDSGPARLTLILAPEFTWTQNRAFQTISFPEIDRIRQRHPLASPFQYPPRSMDLPQRLGLSSRQEWTPGQSSLTLRVGPFAGGAATENLWWGPGIRNALLMSSNAPGVPHLFVRTTRPVELGIGNRWIGAAEAYGVLGRLHRSDYFFGPGSDPDAVPRFRSLSAFAVTLRPAFDEHLTLGIARAVYAPTDDAVPIRAGVNALRSVGVPGPARSGEVARPGRDQILSVFWRWAFPGVGFEAYGEWGRYEQPRSLRDLFELPHHSQGYTVGSQWTRSAAPLGRTGHVRIQGEITDLEPSITYRVRESGEWYAGRRVPEGYTHRGRVLGAAIGPSGSSQWLGLDWFDEGWWVGTFVGRIRWQNEAQQSFLPEERRADVSLFSGVRGAVDIGPVRLDADFTSTARLNYLFQTFFVSPEQEVGVDIANHTLSLTLSVPGRRP